MPRAVGRSAELRAWYRGSLQPRLAAGVARGVVDPVEAAAAHRLLASLLGLTKE